MNPLITQRLCFAALWMANLAWVVVLVRIGRKQIAGSTNDRCPKCRYDTKELPTPICPECGLDLHSPSAAALRRAASIGKRGLLTITALFGIGLTLWLLAQDLLQIRRLDKIGFGAFFPAWSYFDDTFDVRDFIIIAGAIAVYPMALIVALGGRQPRAHRSG